MPPLLPIWLDALLWPYLPARLFAEAAIEQLLTHLAHPLRGMAMNRLRDWYEAEDAAQETGMVLCRRAQAGGPNSFPCDRAFRGFVWTIHKRQILQLLDRRARRPVSLDPIDSDLSRYFDPTPPPDSICEMADACRVVREAMTTLDEKYRQVLVLIYQDRRNSPQTAALMGSNKSTVRTWRCVALQLLAAEVARCAPQMTDLLRALASGADPE